LRDQLKRLEDLQTHDAKIQELASALEAIPRKIQATESDVARVEGLLGSERAQIDETRRYLTEQRGLLDMENHQVHGAKQKLSGAKNPREMNAAQREIDQTRELATSRETEIKKLVEALDAKEKVLKERTGEIQKLREAVTMESEAARGKVDTLTAEIARLNEEREAIANSVPKQILSRYAVIRKRKGTAIAVVNKNACSACNMGIPPQLLIVIRRGKTIEGCPSCNRILFFDVAATEASIAAPTNPSDVPKQSTGSDQD